MREVVDAQREMSQMALSESEYLAYEVTAPGKPPTLADTRDDGGERREEIGSGTGGESGTGVGNQTRVRY